MLIYLLMASYDVERYRSLQRLAWKDRIGSPQNVQKTLFPKMQTFASFQQIIYKTNFHHSLRFFYTSRAISCKTAHRLMWNYHQWANLSAVSTYCDIHSSVASHFIVIWSLCPAIFHVLVCFQVLKSWCMWYCGISIAGLLWWKLSDFSYYKSLLYPDILLLPTAQRSPSNQ